VKGRALEISANIRKSILADKSLNAQNVKIITSGGRVTLRGPVKNETEKITLEAKAHEVTGKARHV
jgi:osmotically-inducible protein OsmY